MIKKSAKKSVVHSATRTQQLSPGVKRLRTGVQARPSSSDRPIAKAPANTKQAKALAQLRQPNGTTVSSLMTLTGWQRHSVRGFLTGAVKQKLKLKLTSAMRGNDRYYKVAP